ncbi:maltokinase N-terminal cap-like domain-containing protein [Georgenia ruanii]|uniref:Maltokinase n=1 Tax=Georgenia ruanii TaxID=348442 RepID=A0A7J9UVN7_9MICO|nr:phosphotransferase [Georgenia ruanii]MPV87804.1 phosphotransferase [Georgenia ruanii]
MTASEALRAALPAWMARQRWYTGKGREPRLEPVGGLALPGPDGVDVATWLVRDVGAADPVLYQVPLTVRPAAVPGLEHAVVAEGPGQVVYDGCHDPAGAAALLAAVVDEARLGPPGGDEAPADPADAAGPARPGGAVVGARGHRIGAPVSATGSRVLRGEQSNTSIIFDVAAGAPVILKVFRVVQAGRNPDVEVQEALASGGSTRVPRPLGDLLGWWPAGAQRAEGHLAFAQEFLPGVEDAWRVALRALETGTDFAGRARALGEATAEVHAVLARTLPTAEADAAAREAVLSGWRQRFAAARDAVPELAARADDVEAVLRAGAAAPWPPLQRIHGDYHLGQVLDVPGRGWVLLDFEGEPLRPLAERTAPDLPQRDIAGMLRSFDYAAGSATVAAGESGHGDRAANRPASTGPVAVQAAELDAHHAWARRAREAFLDGYGAATGRDPRADAALLRALELDKALYEAVYEARNRPDWLPIPRAGVARLLAG